MKEIIRLGRREREILSKIESGDGLGKLAPNDYRAIKSLTAKDLIVKDGDTYVLTGKTSNLARTEKDKNRIRAQRRTAHLISSIQGISASSLYRAKKIYDFAFGDRLLEAMKNGQEIGIAPTYDFVCSQEALAYLSLLDGESEEQILADMEAATETWIKSRTQEH